MVDSNFNVSDLSSYLDLQSKIFNDQNFQNSVSSSNGPFSYLISQYASWYNPSAVRSPISSFTQPDPLNPVYSNSLYLGSTPPVNIFDFLSGGSSTISHQLNYSESALSGQGFWILAQDRGSGFYQLSNVGYAGAPSHKDVPSLQEMEQFYSIYSAEEIQSHSMTDNNGHLPGVDYSWWTNSDPLRTKMFYFFSNMISRRTSGSVLDSIPPNTLGKYLSEINLGSGNISYGIYVGPIPPPGGSPSGVVSPGGFYNLSTPPDTQYIKPVLTATVPQAPSGSSSSAFENNFRNFLSAYSAVGINPPTPQNFIQSWYNFIQTPVTFPSNSVGVQFTQALTDGGSASTIVSTNITGGPVSGNGTATVNIPSGTNISSLVNGFVSTLKGPFLTALGLSGEAADWAGIANLTEGEKTTLFNNTFSAFVQAIEAGEIETTNATDFFNQWDSFVGPSLYLQTSTLNNYKAIYEAFFGDSTGFLSLVSGFVNQFLTSSTGVFNPSLMSDQWFTLLLDKYLTSNGQKSGQPLKDAGFNLTAVIPQLLSLLNKMLGDIQELTAAQAGYSDFLTKWQGAYTALTAQIPSYTKGTLPGFANDLSSQDLSNLLGQLTQLNQKYTEQLGSYSAQVQNLGKQQTTLVSQSTDAISQTQNLFSTLIQQMQTILQSIWK